MLTLDAPSVPPTMTETQIVYVVADASPRGGSVGEFGYCMIADDSGGGGMSVVKPFEKMIPSRIVKALHDSARLGVSVLDPGDEEWLANWQKSFSVKVLRQPEHGEVRAIDESLGYFPEKGYLGSDRVDVLVEGKTPDKQPISALEHVFVRVVSSETQMRLLRDGAKWKAYIKRNCPASSEFWRIGHPKG